MKRVILIVLDSVGVGELPDAGGYGDVGANTLGNTVAATGLRLPNMERLVCMQTSPFRTRMMGILIGVQP